MATATPYTDRMHRKLTDGLSPTRLDIEDQSNRHIGHAGAHPEGETHFHITIVSEAFAGKSRVERQRIVYALLKDEMAERVHALALTTLAPQEDR